MRRSKVITGFVPLMVLMGFLGTMTVPVASYASLKGRKNTAIALSAATLYELIHGKGGNALVLGAGSAYAWKRYNDSRHRHRR